MSSAGNIGIISLCATPDGRHVIAGSADGAIRVWDLVSQQVLRPLTGHEDRVTALASMADGDRVVSASPDHTIRVWDVKTGEPLVTFAGDSGITACAVAHEAGIVIAGDSSGRVHFFDDIGPAAGWTPPRRTSAGASRKQREVPDTSMRASDWFYEILLSAAFKGIPIVGQLSVVAGAVYGWRAGGFLKAILYGAAGGITGLIAAGLVALVCWLTVGIPLKLWDRSKGRRWSRVR